MCAVTLILFFFLPRLQTLGEATSRFRSLRHATCRAMGFRWLFALSSSYFGRPEVRLAIVSISSVYRVPHIQVRSTSPTGVPAVISAIRASFYLRHEHKPPHLARRRSVRSPNGLDRPANDQGGNLRGRTARVYRHDSNVRRARAGYVVV